MDARTRELVRKRAGQRCEYCHLPERAVPYFVFHVDHIIAKQHLDEVSDDPRGLAWSCSECNYHKGPNLVSIDPETKEQATVFNPRLDDWESHFTVQDGRIGRASVQKLALCFGAEHLSGHEYGRTYYF